MLPLPAAPDALLALPDATTLLAPLAVTWYADPVFVELGPLRVRWYGLLFALGFLSAHLVLQRIFRLEGKPQQDLDVLTITMMLLSVLGGRLGHCLFYEPERYLADPIRMLYIWEGGMASHGGGIGIILGLIWFSRKYRYPFVWLADRLMIVVALMSVFIRTGNLMNSEIYGIPTDLPWGFIYLRTEVDLLPRHPTQIYESLYYLLLFGLLYAVYLRQRPRLAPGLLTGLYLVIFFTGRFTIEFVKNVQVPWEQGLPLNQGQMLSIPFILAGFGFLAYAYRHRPSSPVPPAGGQPHGA